MTSRKNFILIALVFLVSGCLNSPLLDHVQATPLPTPELETNQSTENSQTSKSTESEMKSNVIQTESVTANCQPLLTTQGLCVSMQWEKRPTEEEAGEFSFRFWRALGGTPGGPYVSPSDVEVRAKLWMPSMGHGSSPITVAPVKDASGSVIPGVYQATQVFFSMPGAWEIWIEFKKNGKVVDRAKFDETI